ncbi:MAG: hypothetical protein HHAS10_01870 [Candidatus Altimarinota bacterium]
MRKIVAPLALIASISLLTSCTKKPEAPAVIPTPTETPAPVMQDGVSPTPVTSPSVNLDTGAAVTSPEKTETSSTSTQAPQESSVSRTETVQYNTPAGSDSIEFSVTVTDGIIASASAVPKADHDISKKLQEGFATKLSESVVGKKAKDLDVDAIGGASLTTNAFEMFVHSF